MISTPVASADPAPVADSDWRLFLRLWPYLRRYRRQMVWPLLLLLPLSLANALQPVLIGQAISLIRQEPVFDWLAKQTLQGGLNLLILALLVTVVLRLGLDGY
ncbi:MAG: ABC transporter ATP-binding protein, partial [Cyanobacteriota bacterium]|nr:ABC transporter ATP-binding protein [Cyanobacteriota bacterium]